MKKLISIYLYVNCKVEASSQVAYDHSQIRLDSILGQNFQKLHLQFNTELLTYLSNFLKESNSLFMLQNKKIGEESKLSFVDALTSYLGTPSLDHIMHAFFPSLAYKFFHYMSRFDITTHI